MAGTIKKTHPFRCLGKSYSLFRRDTKAKPATAETPWSFRLRAGGKRVLISTRTASIEAAVKLASERIAAVTRGQLGALDVGRAETGQAKVPTFGEARAVYVGAGLVRPRTAAGNWSGLVRLVRAVTGRAVSDGDRIDIVTGELARAWLAKKQGRTVPDYGQQRPGNVSANSTLRQAQSVFAKRHLSIWREWRLPPGVEEFRAVKMLPQSSMRYTPLPESALAKMDAAVAKIRDGSGPDRGPTVRGKRARNDALAPPEKLSGLEFWIVNRSIRLMGLRDSEVAAMRTSWLSDHAGRLHLDVCARPGEFVPKGHQGRVQVPMVLEPIFRERMAEAEASGEPAHLIRAATATARHDLIYRAHSKWLRGFFPAGRKKTNHELRKHAGSLVAMKMKSWEAAARFLREDLETAKKHYLELLQPVGLDESDLTY